MSAQRGDTVVTPPYEIRPVLYPGERVRVDYGFERIIGVFGGWRGDTLAVFILGTDPELLEFGGVGRISVRRRMPSRAIGAGILGGLATLATYPFVILAHAQAHPDGCDCPVKPTAATWFARGAILGAGLYLIVDTVHPSFIPIYRRPAPPPDPPAIR